MIQNPLKYYILFFLLGFVSLPAFAQLDNRYFRADELLRSQQYEQAFQQFYALYQEKPGNFTFLDKTVESLINLKRYEKAISLTQQAIDQQPYKSQAKILLGEIYHISGDVEKADSIWGAVQKNNSNNIQILRQLARTLSDRSEFDRAISIYQNIKQRFSNSDGISLEMASIYMQAGEYENAIREYLRLVKQSPGRISLVQQRLIRFRDDNIYDVAILEISDFLETLSPDHPSYRNLQQLEIWFLMERNLYQRALVTAKKYEEQSSRLSYFLYNIGSRLLAAQKFELAEKAYSYYIDKNIYSLKFRAMEELANVYRQWAQYLENYNLALTTKREELYKKAYDTLESIRSQKPNYRRIDNVLIALSELSLDIKHEPEKTSQYLSELKSIADSTTIPQEAYIQGRLHLYDNDYARARISFTESRKQQKNGSLAEKARYYLALTDFYAGDYEFAKIQLNALERQNTSYFANDAVQLRLWIQNGLQADSTGAKLEPFAKALEYFAQGKDQLGINKLQDLLNEQEYNPLTDDAILELSKNRSLENTVFIYKILSSFLDSDGAASPLYERLLWERARLAERLYQNPDLEISGSKENADKQYQVPETSEALISLYEEILLKFPNGFYATYVRQKIEELQNRQT